MAYSLYCSCLIGVQAPRIQQQFEMMERLPPQVGELVLITAAGGPVNRLIGWLYKVEDIPWREKEEGEEYAPTTRYWTIRQLNGEIVKWENVHVIRVAISHGFDSLAVPRNFSREARL